MNIEVKGPTFIALMGPSGSGKTTLMRILATLQTPSRGTVTLCGYNSFALKSIHPIMGYVPSSDQGLFSRLTGRHNLQLWGALRGLSPQEIRTQMERYVSPLHLEQALETPFALCSAGMKHRLLLLRELLHQPRILLLDEITRSLDPKLAETLIDTLTRDHPNRITLLATHKKEEWQKADEIWEIRNNRIERMINTAQKPFKPFKKNPVKPNEKTLPDNSLTP